MASAVCSLCQLFQSLLDQFGLGPARPGNNFFTDRYQTSARCLPTPVLYNCSSQFHKFSWTFLNNVLPFVVGLNDCKNTGLSNEGLMVISLGMIARIGSVAIDCDRVQLVLNLKFICLHKKVLLYRLYLFMWERCSLE